MIQDHSVDFQDTWNFLHQRFEDTRTITNSRKQIDNIMEETYNITVAGLTTVRFDVNNLLNKLSFYGFTGTEYSGCKYMEQIMNNDITIE